MKRIISILCAAVLLFSLTACSDSGTDYSNQTLTGQVTAIDGTKVTLQLGEITEQDMQQTGGMGDGQTPPDMSERTGDRETPPEIPDGDTQGEGQEPPEAASGADQNRTPPDMPEGTGDGETPPGKPDGGGGKMAPGGMTMPEGNMTMNAFTAGEETATIDLDGAAVQVESGMETAEGTLDDISVDAVLVIEIGDNNAVTMVTVKFTLADGTALQ